MAYDHPIASRDLVGDRVTRSQVVYVPQRGLVGSVAAAFHRGWRIVRQARLERANVRALARLSNAQLKDIGVTRGEIPYLARASAAAHLAAAGLDPFGQADGHDARRSRS